MAIVDEKFIGAYHFSDSRDKYMYEPMRNNTFLFTVPNIGDLTQPYDNAGSDVIKGTDAEEYLTLSVMKAPIPTYSIAPIEIRRGNSVMKAAGLPTFNQGELTVRDFIGADCLSVLQAWQKLAYDPETQLVGNMADYKRDCYLTQYNVDYSEVVHRWLLKGCWISALSQNPVDVESGDARTVTATIQFDSGHILSANG